MTDSALPMPRLLTSTDAPALLSLIEACDIADIGEPDYSMEDVEDDLSRATWQGWALAGPDGALSACCWVEHRPGKPDVEADVRVHPDADGSLGERLLEFARERAADLAPGLPLHIYTAATGTRARGWYDAAGGRVIRHYWRMTIDLPDEPAPVPPAPAVGVTLEQPGEDIDALRTVHHVIDTAFLDHFGFDVTDFDEWLTRQRSGSGADVGLWWLARVDGAPAAALIGRAWPDTGWVQGLGTLREFRGHGLGRLMLLTAFAEFHRRGYRKVGLGVDADNPTGAVGLYESVGMKPAYEAVRYELPPV